VAWRGSVATWVRQAPAAAPAASAQPTSPITATMRIASVPAGQGTKAKPKISAAGPIS
jgi:hypothetical protein